ncbi:hypothetical protein [Labedaea rhizosphaerae]|uniref:Uncharacterized protein n=1 Tax=Labedaea rhizosphaerae TaxID=598644 RepID=A0A4R6SFV1_LABRH|nr:hypothetical protein [Labedaea rhizosphaerae]TDP98075.1 hypothetical protein EV186_1031055 [Labedaea rhizosphaerae]
MRRVVVLASVLVVAACGSEGGTAQLRPTPTSVAGGTITRLPTSTTASAGRTCHRRSLRIEPGDKPAPVCVREGDELPFRSSASPHQPWLPLTSSAPAVVRCSANPAPDGGIAGTCTAVAAGHATLSTSTSPFAGDPGGPPQFGWQVRVTVTG